MMPKGSRPKILGGTFGLERSTRSPRASLLPFSGPKMRDFLSVRCALAALCAIQRPPSVWLPSFFCGSLREPFVQAGVPIRYYGIDGDLHLSATGWISEIRAGDMVLVIHYFGFPNTSFPAESVSTKGALIVEDASQALFLRRQFRESACILYSPRKFLGVPDSGIMVSETEIGAELAPMQEPPPAWWNSALAMTMQRRDFDLSGRPTDWYRLFQLVESTFPLGPYRASDLSLSLISAADYDSIRTIRRANYERLLETAGEYALFPDLEPDVAPLGFPVRVNPEIRDRVLKQLHAARIYAPVHWPIEGIVPHSFRSSHDLALSSLTLLCDQRCTLRDMDRQASVFLDAVAVHSSRISRREP